MGKPKHSHALLETSKFYVLETPGTFGAPKRILRETEKEISEPHKICCPRKTGTNWIPVHKKCSCRTAFMNIQKRRALDMIYTALWTEVTSWLVLLLGDRTKLCSPACYYFYYYYCSSHYFIYRYAPHKDVSVNDGSHIRQWSHTIIILYYNIIILTIV
jgi:hypothetical protein